MRYTFISQYVIIVFFILILGWYGNVTNCIMGQNGKYASQRNSGAICKSCYGHGKLLVFSLNLKEKYKLIYFKQLYFLKNKMVNVVKVVA